MEKIKELYSPIKGITLTTDIKGCLIAERDGEEINRIYRKDAREFITHHFGTGDVDFARFEGFSLLSQIVWEQLGLEVDSITFWAGTSYEMGLDPVPVLAAQMPGVHVLEDCRQDLELLAPDSSYLGKEYLSIHWDGESVSFACGVYTHVWQPVPDEEPEILSFEVPEVAK